MIPAGCALSLALVVICASCASKKKNDPTLLWFGAVIGLIFAVINGVLYAVGGA
jgi:hypothetical protein